jgi:dTMP kinase
MLIVIEGCDAAGKNTLARGLHDFFIEAGKPSQLFSFPNYETATGKLIQRMLKPEAPKAGMSPDDLALIFQCVMVANKLEDAPAIDFALNNGEHVICDRYWQSGYVYGTLDGLSPQWLWEMQHSLPAADVCLLLDLPVEETARRRPEFRDRYEADRKKQEQLRIAYRQLWSEEEWPIIDASMPAPRVLEAAKRAIAVAEKSIEASMSQSVG